MGLPKNLMQRCVAVFHDHAKKVLRSSKDGKAEQSVQFALQRLINSVQFMAFSWFYLAISKCW